MTAFEADTWLHPIADMVEQLAVATSTLEIIQQIEDAQQFASLGLWRWRVGSQEFAWSAQLYRIVGRDQDFKVTLDSTIACIHPQDREPTMARLLEAIRDKTPYEGEFRIVRPDGSERHCWAKFRPALKGDHVLAVRGVCLDITDCKLAETALRESEEHYRHTVENMPQMAWTADPDGKVLAPSPRWAGRTGRRAEEALGSGWVASVHPEDRANALRAVAGSRDSGEPLDVMYRVHMADGSYRWVRSQARPRRNEAGEIIRWYGVNTDIHDQIETERRLVEAEERYRLAMGATRDGIWQWDLATDWVTHSKAEVTTFGYSPAELSGTSQWWKDRIHPEDHKRVVTGIETAIQGDFDDWADEYRYRKADGSYAFVLDRASIIRGDDGTSVRLVGASADVTERRLAEQSLRESEEHYRFTIELNPHVPWTADPQGNILEVSPRFVEMTGMSAEEALGEGWSEALHPDDLEPTLDQWSRALVSDDKVDVRYRLRQRDGSYRWFRARAGARCDESGAIMRWYGLLEDIHEQVIGDEALRESRGHLQAVIEATPDFIKLVAADGRLLQINPAGLAMIEASAADDAIGIDVGDLIEPANRALWRSNHARVIAGETLTWEYKLIGLAGTPRHMEMRATPFQTSAGETVLLGISRDVTRRKQVEAEHRDAEKALKQLQAELVHVSRVSAMGTMASALAHELNQPLTAAANYLQASTHLLSRQTSANPQLLDAIGNATDQILRAGEIVRRLRSLVTKKTASPEVIPIQQTIDEALKLSLADAKSVGVSWHVSIDPAARHVYADRIQVEQVLINLIRNAVDAMRDCPTKMLAISTRKQGADKLQVDVVDSGPGISAEARAKLFGAFNTTKADGMGIGLSISQTIVEAQGGRIWADNEPTGGARFSFTLPVAAARDAPRRLVTSSQPADPA